MLGQIISIISVVISLIAVSVTIFFNTKGLKSRDEQSLVEKIKNETIVNTKLDTILGSMNGIKNDISSIKDEVKDIRERLVIVEQKAGSAHHRLDNIERRIDFEDDRK